MSLSIPFDAYRTLREPNPSEGQIAAFGYQAHRWAARLSGFTSCILADDSASAEALAEATHRRRFAAVLTGPMIDDARSVVARSLAPRLVASLSEPSKLRPMLDALANNSLVVDGVPQSSIPAITEPAKTTLRDLYLFGTATLARSSKQAHYLGELFGRYRPGYVVRPGVDADVPMPVGPKGRGSIVIWAPRVDTSALTLHLFALAELKTPLVIIGAGEALGFAGVTVEPIANAQSVLSEASLIVDATLSDPATAIALAAWKIPLVVSTTSGADEFLDGVRMYNPWNWRSILAAASAGRADPAPTPRAINVKLLSDVSTSPANARRRETPLVTIMVPTFDRPEILPIALDSLEGQSYPNLEILVVNDGGPSIQHIVAHYPRARAVSHSPNRGLFNSFNDHLSDARGAYIGFLADDDIYYFDHVERLVAALDQSNAQVAHSNALTRFLKTESDGTLRTSGNQVLFAGHLDTTEILSGGAQTTTAILIRRDVFDAVGMFDASLPQADYEFLVRLSRSYDFIHVDHVTCEWRYRTDRGSMSHSVGLDESIDGLRRIFAKYPSGGNSLIDQGRAQSIDHVRTCHGTQYWQPAISLDTTIPIL